MRINQSNWTTEEQNKFCEQNWIVEGQVFEIWNTLLCEELKEDDWTCDPLIEAVDKDVKDGMSEFDILTKYCVSFDW
jgi:hypothetical protein